MMNMEILSYIKEFSDFPIRTNCPVCYNKNTFVANIVDGKVKYYCFHASCGLKGSLNHERSLEEIRNINTRFANNYSSNVCIERNNSLSYMPPNYWVNPLQNERCLNFIQYWNLLEPYIEGRISLYYDPRQERCVFLIKDYDGNIHGATGRALYRSLPRWLIYHRSNSCPGFIRGQTSGQLILVEDFISAVAATRLGRVGVALLGTNIPIHTISYIKDFDQAYIALDPDATGKAVKLQQQLNPYIKTFIIPLQKDLKYFNQEELNELERKWIKENDN